MGPTNRVLHPFPFGDYQEEVSTLGSSTDGTLWKAAPSTRLHAYEASHVSITAIKYTVLCLAGLRRKAIYSSEQDGRLACMEWAALVEMLL